jgi:hypothetical protein
MLPSLSSFATQFGQGVTDGTTAGTALSAAQLNQQNQQNIVQQTQQNIETDAANGMIQAISHMHYPQ